MIAVLLKLALGGWNVLKIIGAALKSFFAALNIQGWIGLIACGVLAFLWFRAEGESRHWHKQSTRFEVLYNGEKTAFDKTVADYRAAAAKQKAEDDAKNARTVAQQQAINQEKSNDYEARLAAARAEYQRLQRASASHPSGGAGTPMPGLSLGTAGLAHDSEQDGLSLADRFTCTAQSIQLDELIKWVKAQHEVDPNAKAEMSKRQP